MIPPIMDRLHQIVGTFIDQIIGSVTHADQATFASEERMHTSPTSMPVGRAFGLRSTIHTAVIALLVLIGSMPGSTAAVADHVPAAAPVCPAAIAMGETIECTIAALDEADRYLLTADAGDQISVRVTRTGGTFRPRVTVQQASGDYLCGNFALDTTEAICAIPADGSYTIVIDDAFRERTGSYYLHVQRFNDPVGAQPLPIGQPIGGALDLPAEADLWTFAAQAGDRMLVRVSRSGGTFAPRIAVYDQMGRYVCGGYNTQVTETDCTFDVAGTYALLIDDTFRLNSGMYYVYAQRFNAPAAATPIRTGQSVSNAIDVPAESDAYVFTGGDNERRLIRVARTGGTFEPRVTVFDARGGYVCGGYDTQITEVVCVLPGAGTFLLLVDDTFRAQAGRYDLVLDCPSTGCDPQCPSAGCGSEPILDRRVFMPMIVGDP